MEPLRVLLSRLDSRTDETLGSDESGPATSVERTAAGQRVLDDLIERDRLRADQRLRKFRNAADRALAHHRAASLPDDRSIWTERRDTDEEKKAEREVTDGLLEQERQRSDTVVAVERLEHAAILAQQKADWSETNDQLTAERIGADAAVTALRETTKALADTRIEQERTVEVLGMVTHDLRSPLCVIAMNAASITESSVETATCEAAREVTRAAARMDRLLTDLLDVARIESATFTFVKRRHDVSALLTEVFQSYRPLFAAREIAFVVAVPAAALVTSFDHDRIVQVLSNLLSNAMKFTPARGTVSLHVERRDQQVEFMLQDTGPGIPPDALPHVFRRFWQSDKDNRRGSGWGSTSARRSSKRTRGASGRRASPAKEPPSGSRCPRSSAAGQRLGQISMCRAGADSSGARVLSPVRRQCA